MAEADDKAITAEFHTRWQRAEQDKTRQWGRYDDIYRLVMPQRHRQDQTNRTDTLDEIFDATAMDALSDFASDMLNGFTPPFTDEWIKLAPVEGVTQDAAAERELVDAIAEYKRQLFEAISESNLTDAARECMRDLAAGTCAILIQDRHPSLPIVCECIPISDLWLDRGPGGAIDGIFRRFRPRAEHVPVMWPGAKRPGGVAPETEIEVKEGLWRDWSDPGKMRHRYVVMHGADVLLDTAYEGDGSCPMIVTRWDTDPTTAWGTGPLWTALPDIKTLNKAVELTLRNADKAIDPPTLYDDDGVIDVSAGIQPGDWIPRMTGSKVDTLEPQGRFDLGFLLADQIRDAVKRALYQNRPEQKGLTPPTATQWLDMAQDLARRLGAPAGSLVNGWQFPIIKRFAYLLAQRGTVPAVKFGKGGLVALKPTSALVMSQAQEEALRIQQFIGFWLPLLGEQGPLRLDLGAAAEAHQKNVGIGDYKLVRSDQQVAQLIQQLAQAAQAMQGGQPR